MNLHVLHLPLTSGRILESRRKLIVLALLATLVKHLLDELIPRTGLASSLLSLLCLHRLTSHLFYLLD